MKKIIKMLACVSLFCGHILGAKKLIVRYSSGDKCGICVRDEANLVDIFGAIANVDNPEFADKVLDPMLKSELVYGNEVLNNEACKGLSNEAELTLVINEDYFVQSQEVSDRSMTWCEERNKHIKHNEERFVMPVKATIYMALYGINYKTNGWQNYHNPYWDPNSSPERCALAKWFLNNPDNNPKNMTIEDADKFFKDFEGIYIHRVELIQRMGSNLQSYVLNFEATPNLMKKLFAKLLELENTDELITEDKLPKPQYEGHEWISSSKEFSSTYALFQS